jgi:AcrR family transcriptional regulator
LTSHPNAEQSNRLPRGALDRERVVAAAIEIADREGLEALTMARVAGALGASPMSLYRHLRDKQELLEAVADLAVSEMPMIARDGRPWRARVEEFAREGRLAALRHPALVEIVLENHLYGPAAVSVGLDWVGLLREAGFDEDSSIRAYMALRNHMIGALAWEVSRFRRGRAEFIQEMAEWFGRHDLPADSPLWRLGEVVTEDPEALFLFGVNRLLDGLEAELRRSRRASTAGRNAT